MKKKTVKKNDPVNIKKEFIILIDDALKTNRLSLRELSRRTSLDVSFLSKILSGKRNPPSSEKDIVKMAQILKINPERLLFSAGRIPSSLQNKFNDENFIEELLSTSELKHKTVPPVSRVSVIEDELL